MTYLHVKATVGDYDEWNAEFEELHSRRAEHGGQSYQIFQTSEGPDQVVVLIEFTDEESARSWVEYLNEEEAMEDSDMSGVEISYLEMVEEGQL